MIEGVVSARHEPTLTITIQGRTGPPREIEAVVDTGFNGYLSLRPELMGELNLRFDYWDKVTVADGRRNTVAVHAVTVHCGGEAHEIPVHALGTKPLIGMLLLAHHDMYMEVEPGGRVALRARGRGASARWTRWWRGVGWGPRPKLVTDGRRA